MAYTLERYMPPNISVEGKESLAWLFCSTALLAMIDDRSRHLAITDGLASITIYGEKSVVLRPFPDTQNQGNTTPALLEALPP